MQTNDLCKYLRPHHQEEFDIVLFDLLSFGNREDLAVIAMMGYSIFSKAPGLKPYPEMIDLLRLGGPYLSVKLYAAYSTA